MNMSNPSVRNYALSLTILITGMGVIVVPSYLLEIISLKTVIAVLITTLCSHFVGYMTKRPSGQSQSSHKAKNNTNTSETHTAGNLSIYVGNLQYRTKREELVRLFSPYGNVDNARIITDRETRKSKGYGFIEMSAKDAKTAIEALNGSDFNGRSLRVNEAKDR